jgi:hypothetical protein
VPADVSRLVDTKTREFIAGTAHPFKGPLRDNRGAERVKAGDVFTELRKMDWLVDLAASNRMPLVAHLREFADAGGLMTYGPKVVELHRRAAT